MFFLLKKVNLYYNNYKTFNLIWIKCNETINCRGSSVVERFLGKKEAMGSIPILGFVKNIIFQASANNTERYPLFIVFLIFDLILIY